MFEDKRVLYDLSDVSYLVNDLYQGSYQFNYTASGHYLYFGFDHPANHLYFDLASGATGTSTASIQMFWGSAWQDAVDVRDLTSASGISLYQSGYIYWNTHIEKGWDLEDRTLDITELSTLQIYDKYWLRMSWNANTAATINYIGHKFNNDLQLYGLYPDLNNTDLKTTVASGKTDWNQEALIGAQHLLTHMRSRNIIWSKNQVLDPSRFIEPACHKTAEIIYGGLGKAYNDLKLNAANAFLKSIDSNFLAIDKNANGRLDYGEKTSSIRYMDR